jgi:N-acetylmuramoyl-L-alanine amidase
MEGIMWDKILNFFAQFYPEQEVVHKEAPKPKYKNSPAPAPQVKKKKIAIVVGHEANKMGMKLYTGEYEYQWNKKLSERIKKLYKGPHEIQVYFRDHIGVSGVATQAGGWGAELLIELHLNAAGIPAARGCEALVINTDKPTQVKAKILVEMISQTMGVKIRHQNGLKLLAKGERGYPNLLAYKNAGITNPIIIEPFFADYETDESKFFIKNPDLYADVICRFIDS